MDNWIFCKSDNIRFNFRRIYTDTSIENRAKYNSNYIWIVHYIFNFWIDIVANLKKLIQYIILYFVFLLLLCIQWTFTQTWQIQYPLLIPVAYYCFDAYRNISNFKRTYIRGSQYLNTIERNRDRHDNEIELEVLIRCRRKILFKNTFENMMLALTYILIMFSSAQVLPIPLYSWIAPLLITFISKLLYWSPLCLNKRELIIIIKITNANHKYTKSEIEKKKNSNFLFKIYKILKFNRHGRNKTKLEYAIFA